MNSIPMDYSVLLVNLSLSSSSYRRSSLLVFYLFAVVLVDSILEEYKNSHDHYHSTTTTTVIPPLDITILTNDICFLSDINQASHKRAIHTFWDRVKPNFLESKIRNLHIIVISTDSVVVVENDDADDDDDDDKGNNNVDNDQEEEEGDPRSDAPATSSSSSNHEEEGETTEMLERKRAISIAKLMNTMSQLLDTKCEAEFKENKSCIQFDVAHHHTPAINIQLSTIDNTSVGFNALLRRWSRDMLSGHGRVVRLTLDLPETSAFSECSVSLDASLPMVPFGRLDSDLSRRLLTDLKFLSQSKLEVVQLVPIESIDAALLFGVAIGVRAGLEHDPDQHNEMGLLVRTLFKQLAQRDCALLLRSSKGPNQYPEKEEEKGLFHSPEAQSWLLMAGEVPTPLKGQTAPNSGVLYRMATADHFIEDVMLGPGDIIASDEDDAFVEFVEASLDSLGCSPVNPLYLQSKSNQRKKPFRTLTCNKFTKSQERVWSSDDNNNKEACDVSMGKAATVQRTASLAVTRGGDSNDRDNKVIGWNDDFGVGSMARVFSQESEDSKGGKSPRNYETPKIPTRKVRNELIAKIVSSSKTPIDDDDVEWSDGGGKAVGWNDHSGVGSVARRFSQGSEDQKEKGNESLRNTRKIATKQSRKKVITVKQQNDDEAEWTDGTSSCGFSSPDSGSVAGYSR